ncbi:branched-chain amino acid ABC transporter permease [Alkalihalobacillus sp. BA299]|uniref:branched-chain amino acid ABC transporter permease n=1 Tax=Alkalihalobacillus sp. BA299 TaxID=2815938 RepID=UPI001ADD55CA|nr:branched-chain amino acid ABC transporter permease [Alkalihalobacillus sp. BA299]
MKNSKISLVLFLAILIAFPLVSTDQYYLHIGILILYSALVSQAWNILSGYSGQFSFGHAAFFGVGAYTSTILLVNYNISPWIGMLIGAMVAAVIGLFIGFLSFRYKLRGAYFALGTLAFAEILRIIVQNSPFFKKTLGILIPLNPNPFLLQFSSRLGYYYTILALVAVVTLVVYFISRSRLGYNLIAIRENEDAAQSLGVNTFKNKMIAIALSGGLTAIGGTFYAQYILFIEPPTTFGNAVSIAILLPAIIGGMGTVFGPIVGAFIIIPLGEFTSALFGDFVGVHLMAYGLILVLVILYLPEGIVGWFQNKFDSREKDNEKKVSKVHNDISNVETKKG